MTETQPFEFEGPAELRPRVLAALKGVVDPEMGINIVDLGLVYGVTADARSARLRITMTSAACPVADMITDDVYDAMGQLLGPGADIDVEMCWDPPWTPERMSPRARAVLGD